MKDYMWDSGRWCLSTLCLKVECFGGPWIPQYCLISRSNSRWVGHQEVWYALIIVFSNYWNCQNILILYWYMFFLSWLELILKLTYSHHLIQVFQLDGTIFKTINIQSHDNCSLYVALIWSWVWNHFGSKLSQILKMFKFF
jgi:hypothetical protein